MTTHPTSPTLYRVLTSIAAWSTELMPHRALRSYQLPPAAALVRAIADGGEQLAVVFSRQAGKDEMLAQVLSFVLMRHSISGGTIVVAAPTLHPQAQISQRRLVECLASNPLSQRRFRVRANTVQLGAAEVVFVSASPQANVRGLTASLLLVANEAQDIDPAIWDAVFDPMAASTNATTLFMGTVWSQHGLLARQMRHFRELEAEDGRQRLWLVPWEQVAAELPAYGERVRTRMRQLGINHPFIRTEYCLQELDGDGGLFPPERIARLQGTHSYRSAPQPGYRHALLIDVGGEDLSAAGADLGEGFHGRRDSTAITVVEIDLTSRPDAMPVYRVVHRLLWTGVPHPVVHQRIVGLTQHWQASWLVVDASGLGAGLTSFLQATFSTTPVGQSRVTVVPFVFSASSKSRLGWDFVALIEAGRYQEYALPEPLDLITQEFYAQLRNTVSEVLVGPGRVLRWYVPTAMGHDDLVVSAALCAALDGLDHRPRIARGRSSASAA